MNHLAIVRILSILGIWVSVVTAFCGLAAWALEDWTRALPFFLTAISIGPLGGTVLLLTNKPTRRTRPQDGLAVAVLFWFIVPVICAFPLLSVPNAHGFLGAYYDSVASLTTTGHSVLYGPTDIMPASILLWRAVMHVIGTVATISIAACVLAALNLGGPGIHKSRFFTIPEGSFFDTMPRIIRVTSLIVGFSITGLLAAMLILGVPPREALQGAVSVISTSLVDPHADMSAPSGGVPHALILAFGLVLGTLGLVFLDLVGRGKFGLALKDPESISYFGTIVGIGVLAFFAGLPLLQSLGWAMSSVSTSGIALSDPERLHKLPMLLILLPALIGGAALSAAGGIKLARLIILSKRVLMEFSQLGYRGSIQKFSFRGRIQSERTIMGVWVYLVGYIMAAVFGIFILSLFDLSFNDAVLSSIGSLSNSGYILNEVDRALNAPDKVCIILGMILGRLEVIALIPVLNPSFWTR